MSESIYHEKERPSALSAFIKGATGGLLSGVVMALVVSLVVATILPAVPFLSFGVAAAHAGFLETLAASGPLMVLAPAIFGGIMSVKRALFDAPHSHSSRGVDIVPVPVPAISAPGIAPVMAFADTAPEYDAPAKNWTAETARNDGAQSRIQQILADGSLSDKDRASAILASRESADQQQGRA